MTPADLSDSPEALAEAVERLQGGKTTHVQSVPIQEAFKGKPVWEGVVHIFDLAGHPKASRAYAWSSPIEGSTKRKYYAVLHLPPIDSPQKAIKASIVSDFKAKKGE